MNVTPQNTPSKRISIAYVFIVIIGAIFVFRLFYLQIIKHGYYQDQAQASQLKRYEIPAERGVIYALDGNEPVPVVLNEIRYQIVADPKIITGDEVENTALRVAEVLGVTKDEIQEKLTRDTRYEILAKKQSKQVKEEIEKMYAEGDIVGVFAEKTNQRVYPRGSLASQLLGFVNDEGQGNYGVEEALNDQLGGSPGKVKALTDQNGIPLLASGENILEDPVDGDEVVLTIDIAMQEQLEILLKQGLDNAKSESGSALIIDPNNGQIKAMANYPTYDPAKFTEVNDSLLFTNANVSSTLEPGSIMKTLTTAAALDQEAVASNQTYFDPSFYNIGDATVRNIEEDGGAAVRSVEDIMRLSLNTGATWLLMQMGGGELNESGRLAWHKYMTEHYMLGQTTGVEQGFEEQGYIPDPIEGWGLDIQYANTSFGQGMTATPLQMAAAVSAVINGGTYYQPTLVAGVIDGNGDVVYKEPKVKNSDVVSEDVSEKIINFMKTTLEGNSVTRAYAREGYIVGGKTGTAEIARPEGGYYEDRFNGTYTGYVGGDRPEYVIMVRVNDPKIPGYAGSQAAGPLFGSISNMLIDNFSVSSTIGQ